MARVAIVTDSAADIPADLLAALDISVVPLVTSFGQESFLSGVDLDSDTFYARLTSPGSPFPTTAACPPAAFEEVFRQRLDAGADAVVCILISTRLSATYEAARSAVQLLPDAPIHVLDSMSASMGIGWLAVIAAEMARDGADAGSIMAAVESARGRSRLYLVLDTLEYLRRGGRISAAQAAIGTVLSVKPVITVEHGLVETADRPRTSSRARARLFELLTADPVERACVLHTKAPGVELFADELAERLSLPRDAVPISLVGPTVGTHIGPRSYGAALVVKSPPS